MTIEPTVSDAETLLPCPFCGGAPNDTPQNSSVKGWVFIWCEKCDARGGECQSNEDAIAAWNRRSAIPETEAVAVKPLEWSKTGNRKGRVLWQGRGRMGYLAYVSNYDADGSVDGFVWMKEFFQTDDEAKAAVQADYETSIRSALTHREGDAEARLSVIRKSLLMALYGGLTPRPEPTIELVKALVAVADSAQEATTNARIALMSRTTREAFERELHEGIVNRLGILTVGTCSCDTKSPELKYHSEGCRYRIASEALELARPFYAPATEEREPSRATDTAGDYLVWSNEHRAWWRPNKSGYTVIIDEAGRYPRSEALSIAKHSRDGWGLDGNPDEIAVPLADALECLPAPPLAVGRAKP